MGRPLKMDPMDARTVEMLRGLASIQCTQLEAAAVFRVAISTFEEFLGKENADGEKLRDVYHNAAKEGRASLRRKQFNLATTNPAMAIFLGKNYLDQSDKVVADILSSDGSLGGVKNYYSVLDAIKPPEDGAEEQDASEPQS